MPSSDVRYPGLKGGACVWTPPQLRVASPLHGFGFTVRHVRAFRQDARAHPVLPGEQRSEGHIPGPDQVRMEDEMARLTEEQQPLLGAVVRRGVAAPWARLAGLIGVHLYGHAARKQRLVRDIPVHLDEGPLRRV